MHNMRERESHRKMMTGTRQERETSVSVISAEDGREPEAGDESGSNWKTKRS